ncbi:hypothetical protein [Clostridium sp. UBA1056]|uniref:hypothetical protein n=1 Tax=unclassified Clostridium TaxID=2614128 RepID=UPI0032170693
MSKSHCKTKNKETTTLKADPTSPKYQEGVKNKAHEHSPYGEKEPSTNTTLR